MTNPKPSVAPVQGEERGFALHWAEARADVQQLLVDEATIQFTGDRVYVTFGQVQIPPGVTPGQPPKSLEIMPVARLVFTTVSYHKIADALKNIAEDIRRAPIRTEGGR